MVKFKKGQTNEEREREFYAQTLAEPELLESAIFVTVQDGAMWTQLAVPLGKLKRGGHIVAHDMDGGQQAARLLSGHPGFSNLRVAKSPGYGDNLLVIWGDPEPLNGNAIIRGIYYGYTDEAIAEFVIPQHGYRRKRREMLEFIHSERLRISDPTGAKGKKANATAG